MSLRQKNEQLTRTNSDLNEQVEANIALANKNSAEVKRLTQAHSSLQLQYKKKEVNIVVNNRKGIKFVKYYCFLIYRK